jgi:transcription antitermination factor NusG
MFPGYVFLNGAIDKARYLEVIKARGLVQIVGGGWDRLAKIEDREIEAIRRIVDARIPVVPYAYLHEGQRVRIMHGSFTDIVGTLVRTNENRGLLVVSVELLRCSVAVQVDCTWITPV